MYEKLLNIAENNKIRTYEIEMSERFKGFYKDNSILVNKNLETTEKVCVLIEELGHYFTTIGNILDQNKLENRKQEQRARNWGYEQIVTLDRFIEASINGVKNLYEFAEFVGVTEEFLVEVIKYYQRKYGLYTTHKGYTIYFEKIAVLQMFE